MEDAARVLRWMFHESGLAFTNGDLEIMQGTPEVTARDGGFVPHGPGRLHTHREALPDHLPCRPPLCNIVAVQVLLGPCHQTTDERLSHALRPGVATVGTADGAGEDALHKASQVTCPGSSLCWGDVCAGGHVGVPWGQPYKE